MKRIIDYLLFGLALVLFACSESEPVKLPRSEEYFPLQIGQYWIYNVNQTKYSEVEPKEVSNIFELKSEVIGSFENLEGGVTFVMHDSRRISPEQEWIYIDTWAARFDEFKAVITEKDLSFIQLTFPLYKKKKWDGNDLNTLESDEYVVESVGSSFTTSNESTFEDCVKLKEEDYIDFTYKDERIKFYARNIGLVYKKKIVLQYCTDSNCIGEQIITRGETWIQELKSYGQN